MLLTFASMSSFIVAYTQSDPFGKLIMLGLIALSVICWIVLIQKIWMIRKVRRISNAFQKAFSFHKDQILKLDLSNLPQAPDSWTPHPFAHIFATLQGQALEILKKNHYFTAQNSGSKGNVYLSTSDIELLQNCAQTTLSSQSKHIEKNVFILSTIMTLAPFMGLLGTVWGILITFSGLQSGASPGSNSAILGGLSTALVTTVMGLIIAIPALVSYNYLRNTLHQYDSEMDDFLNTVLASLELQYRKVD